VKTDRILKAKVIGAKLFNRQTACIGDAQGTITESGRLNETQPHRASALRMCAEGQTGAFGDYSA
jgi:hypothetical protein